MPNFVQYGKVGKPIVYNTLPTASEDLKGVCGQVEDKIYICDGSNWNLYSSTTLKKYLDATRSAAKLFYDNSAQYRRSIDDLIAYNDTENVRTMKMMCFSCQYLESIPLLNTSNVTNMNSTFQHCHSLKSIPLFDTSKVTDMDSTFFVCTSLTSIPLLNTSNVTNMNSTFGSCESLLSIPLLNTSKVTKMNGTFYKCSKIVTIPLLDTSNVTMLSQTFLECLSLETIPLLDTSNVTNMYYCFKECAKLVSIPALNVSKVTSFSGCFTGCTSLKSILMTGMKVSFDISASTQFEKSDLVTILNNLATVTETQTLTMGATNLAKLSDEEKAIATNKGWTLA